MMGAMVNSQRGVTMSGFLAAVVVLVLVAIGGMKIAPAYFEDKTIQSKFEEVAHDPELKDATAQQIRLAFAKRATVSDITAIKAEDIEVSKNSGSITLSASYTVKIPLVANASLLLEFNPSSASK